MDFGEISLLREGSSPKSKHPGFAGRSMIFFGGSSPCARNIPLDRGKYGFSSENSIWDASIPRRNSPYRLRTERQCFAVYRDRKDNIALRSVVISSDPNGIINTCRPLRRNACCDGNHAGRGRPTIWQCLLREVNGSHQLSFPPGRKTDEAAMAPFSFIGEKRPWNMLYAYSLSVEIELRFDITE